MARQGEHIQVQTDSGEHSGVFVKDDGEFIFLKLKSGYNIGIAKRRIKSTKATPGGEPKKQAGKQPEAKVSEKKGLPIISLLHTGGTIASRVDYETGAVSAKFTPEEILALFPELGEIANVRSRLVSNIMSENMRYCHYNLIAKAVEEEIKKGASGVIITHGTDMLHYTAAALSFALEGLDRPVLIIGSQRSSDRPSTDSAMNLMCAAAFIANANVPGVFTCLHEGMSDDKCLVLEGVSARKMHSSRRDAFRPINNTAIARVDYSSRKVEILREPRKASQEGGLRVRSFMENIKVGIAKVHPQMFAEELAAFEKFDGLIIEGTGLGHGQTVGFDSHTSENEKIKSEIAKLAKKMPVAMTVQTIYGRVNMNVYSPGRELVELGVLGNYCDMTPETAFIKMAWLLSNYKREEVRELYGKSLRGEITERSEKDTFLI